MTDKEKYLQELRAGIDAEKRKNESMLENFKSASNSSEYKAALLAISVINNEDAVLKAKSLVLDKQEDVSVRILALQKVVTALSADADFLDTCLDLLQDKTEDDYLRMAAFNVLKILRFSSGQFAAIRPDYMSILRALLDDPNVTLRAMAAEDLAMSKDEYVQRRLLAELETGEEKIVQRAKSIQLLGYDLHAEHFPIVRQILQDETASETEKVEAIHVLAKDPSSKELLKNLMLDKTQEKEVRLSSASALQAAQPEEFISVAQEVVLDEKEDKDLRIVSLNGLLQHIESDALKDNEEFLQRVSNLRTITVSPELKRVSKTYVDRMNLRSKTKE